MNDVGRTGSELVDAIAAAVDGVLLLEVESFLAEQAAQHGDVSVEKGSTC